MNFDNDSNDDIFVSRPVRKLARQKALLIKDSVLTSLNSKKVKNKKNDKSRERKCNSTAKELKVEKVDNETSKKNSLKIDCIVKCNKEISPQAVRKSSSKNVQVCLKRSIQEKQEQWCSLEFQPAENIHNASSIPNPLDNCIDLEAESLETSPSINRKRKKIKIIEIEQNDDKIPMKIPDVSEQNKSTTVGEPKPIFSEKKDDIIKSEIKLEGHLDISENDFSGNEVDLKELFDQCSNNFLSDGFLNSLSPEDTSQELEEDRFKSNSKLLSFLMKKIICDERKKQIYLEQQAKSTGKVIEKLLSETDCQILEKFVNLNENASQIFVRMLGRKKYWHRVSSLNYNDISDNLEREFQILHMENFVDINIEDEDLKIQLNLLSKSEILQLCKEFNISSKCGNFSKKAGLIDSLTENIKKQRSIYDMFKRKKSPTDRNQLLKCKIKEYMGMCIKLSDTAFDAFYNIFLLHSFPHYTEEEEHRFRNELYMSLQVHKNFIRFPNYELSPTVVFETKNDFDEYKKALLLNNSFEIAINTKNHAEFELIFNKAKDEFQKLLKNNEYQKRFLNLKPFLRKFSAGTLYAKILSKYCMTFKKQSCNLEKITTTQLLLDQNLFLTGKKGEWYETLSKALESEKKYQSAAEVILKAFEDAHVSEVQKLTLQLRGQLILKKKNSGITVKLREILQDVCTLSIQEPLSIEIKGRALSGDGAASKKTVYIQDCKQGKLFSSVEERAISYYKLNGFTEGYHAEGFIVQSIYFLLFYDIIYGSSVEGVFQSPYQEVPLDFYSASFYDNRKEKIDLLLGDLLRWSDEEIEARIKDVYSRNYKTVCVIKWDDELTPALLFEIIKCITMPVLVLIFKKFIRNFRVFRSGFPDLTLWNPQMNKCKFVEVKSPNDRLSSAQRVWLDYLRSIGLDCEVCNVKNFSGKSLA